MTIKNSGNSREKYGREKYDLTNYIFKYKYSPFYIKQRKLRRENLSAY